MKDIISVIEMQHKIKDWVLLLTSLDSCSFHRQLKVYHIHNVQSLSKRFCKVTASRQCNRESRSVNSLWHNRVSWSVLLVFHRDDSTLIVPCNFFRKNHKFSCDSSRANDKSLIKPLMMILQDVESRDVFGITKQLCTHNDKWKRLLQGKTCTEHLVVCCHNYNNYFVRLWLSR